MLELCLESSIAWERLHDPEFLGNVNALQALELARLADYPEEAAQKIASDHAWARMQRDLPP